MEDHLKEDLEGYQRLISLLRADLPKEIFFERLHALGREGGSGTLMNLIFQAEGAWGKNIGPDHAWKDLHPEISAKDKQQAILHEVEAQIRQSTSTPIHFFTQMAKRIKWHEEMIEVDEVFHSGWGIIIYKAVHSSDYYVNVLKNHSAAYWSKTLKLTQEQGEQLLAHPEYENALRIGGEPEHKRP
jgi:hypothetical protein